MSKSAETCRMAIESLVAGHENCRLWTFTVPKRQPPRETARMWSLLQRDLVRDLHFQAVRVFELHPGGHGLHVHAVTPHFYSVNDVRPLTSFHGWGRIHVKVIPSCAASYVAKYLSKQFWRPYRELRGMRLWACVGRNSSWRGVSCKNVVYDSPSTSFLRAILFHLRQTPEFRDIRRLGYLSSLAANGLCGIRMSRSRFGDSWNIESIPVWDVPVLCVKNLKLC